MRERSTAEVADALDEPNVRLIDVRPIDAYNGWRLRGEARGGHIRGAKAMPRKWARYIDWPDIVRAKGLARTDSLILYGYSEEDAGEVARHFARAGYEDVAVYNGFIDEWAADPDRPMDRLARYRQLVPASWLQTLLTRGTAPEYDNDRYVLCHAHYQNRGAYEEGHIPGAIEIDTNELE
ncbi:MAG: rhodanese-like domain-containing protein, partial [Planctomycetota bacterium]